MADSSHAVHVGITLDWLAAQLASHQECLQPFVSSIVIIGSITSRSRSHPPNTITVTRILAPKLDLTVVADRPRGRVGRKRYSQGPKIIHSFMHTYTHAYTYIPTSTCLPAYIRTYLPAYLPPSLPTYVHTYIAFIRTFLHAEKHRSRQTDKQTDRKTDRQTERETDSQPGRQTDGQTFDAWHSQIYSEHNPDTTMPACEYRCMYTQIRVDTHMRTDADANTNTSLQICT